LISSGRSISVLWKLEGIEKEDVPVGDHEVWEDSIEWRNAVEEIEKLRNLLKELKY